MAEFKILRKLDDNPSSAIYSLFKDFLRFEPSAQGEPKIARDLLPVHAHSHHWLAETDFAQSILTWCASECTAMHENFQYADSASPYL